MLTPKEEELQQFGVRVEQAIQRLNTLCIGECDKDGYQKQLVSLYVDFLMANYRQADQAGYVVWGHDHGEILRKGGLHAIRSQSILSPILDEFMRRLLVAEKKVERRSRTIEDTSAKVSDGVKEHVPEGL